MNGKPIKLANNRSQIDRMYEEAGPMQWVRELLVNSLEAEASKIHFLLEPSAYKEKGIARRMVVDNGQGMDAEELVQQFGALGGSGKAVGGAHENFGIGAKISLLPWNRAGVIVASWKHGVGNFIWLKADEQTGEYVMAPFKIDGYGRTVWPTAHWEQIPILNIDLEAIKPDWLDDHGTLVLLLGNSLSENTMNGPNRGGSRSLKIRSYIYQRFWRLPEGVAVRIEEFEGRGDSKTLRQKSGETALDQIRRLKSSHQGQMQLKDGGRLYWFYDLRPEHPRPQHSSLGFIAARYRDELYELEGRTHRYRQFGITNTQMRERLRIIVEPKESSEERTLGAFPEGDRNALMWDDGETRGGLPWEVWGTEFAEAMPPELTKLIRDQMKPGSITDQRYKKTFADLFEAQRFSLKSKVADPAGDERAKLDLGKVRSGVTSKSGTPHINAEQGGSRGTQPGDQRAKESTADFGIPSYYPVGPDDVKKNMVAAWNPKHPQGPGVMLNVEHRLISGQIIYWQDQYPMFPEQVREAVIACYGESLVARICHSQKLSKDLGLLIEDVDEQFRSDEALTMSALGLILEDRMIQDRLSYLGKKAPKIQKAVS